MNHRLFAVHAAQRLEIMTIRLLCERLVLFHCLAVESVKIARLLEINETCQNGGKILMTRTHQLPSVSVSFPKFPKFYR